MNNENNLLFAQTHEWLQHGDDGYYWIGISNHAQEALGDVMFLQLPQLGSNVKQGDACASIESLKAASDIHAPISGTIVEINAMATNSPEIINAKPYDVWLFKIKSGDAPSTQIELHSLLSASAYAGTLNN